MRASALLDTGAILAMLNRQDRWHTSCTQALSQLRTPLLTTQAVLTEMFYMVSDYGNRVDAAWTFVRSGALTLMPITDADLPSIAQLMRRYHDRPMDFADATLVHLAQRESLTTILTVDFSDFQTYRIHGRQKFRVLPDPKTLRS